MDRGAVGRPSWPVDGLAARAGCKLSLSPWLKAADLSDDRANHVPERPYRTQADAWAQRHVVAQALLDLWWAVVEQVRRSVRIGKLKWHVEIDFIEQSQYTQAVADELNWGQLQLVIFTNRPLGVLGPEPRERDHAPEVGEGGGAKELSPMEERALHQAQAVVGIVGFWGRRG